MQLQSAKSCFPSSIQKSIQKLPNKLTTKEPKKCISYRQGKCFRAFGHVKLSAKIMKNRCNILPKIASKTMLQVVSILDPTWLHFGMVLAPKLGPSWHQNGNKNRCELGKAIFQNSCSRACASSNFQGPRGPSWEPKSTKNRSENGVQDIWHLGSDF